MPIPPDIHYLIPPLIKVQEGIGGRLLQPGTVILAGLCHLDIAQFAVAIQVLRQQLQMQLVLKGRLNVLQVPVDLLLPHAPCLYRGI